MDIALAIIARNRIRSAYGIGGSIGSGVWMALGGAVSDRHDMIDVLYGSLRRDRLGRQHS